VACPHKPFLKLGVPRVKKKVAIHWFIVACCLNYHSEKGDRMFLRSICVRSEGNAAQLPRLPQSQMFT
jgi:hypothetical protein